MPESGPHVVARAGALLRAVAGGEPTGVTTTEAARTCAVPRPTAHRLLTSLEVEGLVEREHDSGRWLLGPELYLLGLSAGSRYDVTEIARPFVVELSARTGESAFFSARRGDQTVCLLREDGSFPLRSHVLHEGVRFPLGVASAGLVVLAHLDARDVDDYLGRTDLVDEWGSQHSSDALASRVTETRAAGFATNPGLVVPGSWGMGAGVFDGTGRPQWALSLTGVEARFGPDRRPTLGSELLRASHALTKALAAQRR